MEDKQQNSIDTKQTPSSGDPDQSLPTQDSGVQDTEEYTQGNDNTADTVSDIERADSDELLKSQDEQLEPIAVQLSFWGRLKGKVRSFWDNKKARYSTLGSLVVVVAVLFVIPVTRYGILNGVGLKSSARITVTDQDSNQPLKNVSVLIGETSGQTNEEGVANLEKIRMGSAQLKIEKLGYAPINKKITVGFGSNELDSTSLDSIGIQITVRVSDWLSGQAIPKVEAESGENSAFANEEGLILLTVPPPSDDKPFKVTLTAENYLSKEVKIEQANASDNSFNMVAVPSHYFISKREGTYDIYRSNLDGSSEKLIIKGTGRERDDLRFSIHPHNQLAALVSTRDGDHNESGYLLSGLHLVRLEEGTLDWLDLAERIELVGWINEYLLYVTVGAAPSANYPQRQKLVSYNTETGESKVLAATDSFNDVLTTHGQVFYATSDSYKTDPEPYFFRVDPTGTEKQVVINRVTWNIFRPEYGKLVFQTNDTGWHEYDLENNTTQQLDGAPGNLNSYLFANGPESKTTAWVEERDGKGVLIVKNLLTDEEKVVHRAAGLAAPLHWIYEDMIIFRVATDQETADYIININSGEPKKISDVSNINGIGRWFYY